MAANLLYILFRGFVVFTQLFPYGAQILIVASLLRAVSFVVPRYKKIARKNLELVFPDLDSEEREGILSRSYVSLARLFVDFIRIPSLDGEWIDSHVAFPQRERFTEIKAQNNGRGILLVSGHLGSFELLPFCMVKRVSPIMFVARTLKPKKLDDWWNSVRCSYGNELVLRKGALKGIIENIQKGTDVGLLFDQNVTRNNAVFVDWFGRPAATTKALGIAALRLKVPILVFAIRFVGDGKYQVEMRECAIDHIYRDDTLTREKKIKSITEVATKEYEELIRQDPEGWFWMHRRWKTTANPELSENFYR